jgi:excisionase family DNA binding protein
VTLRTLYRFIDEGQLPAYKMGRVIRLQARDVDDFIERARIVPGTLEHLYPDPRGAQSSRSQHQDNDQGREDDQHHADDQHDAEDKLSEGPSIRAPKRAAEVMDFQDVQGKNGQ